ncbi:MAG: hypothetical protein KH901_08105, partial [Streptococcus vestibularis]|nr:hypothetical protein [Streptococcus vestibularis]
QIFSIAQQKLLEPLPYEKDMSFLNLWYFLIRSRGLIRINLELSLSHLSESDYSSQNLPSLPV